MASDSHLNDATDWIVELYNTDGSVGSNIFDTEKEALHFVTSMANGYDHAKIYKYTRALLYVMSGSRAEDQGG